MPVLRASALALLLMATCSCDGPAQSAHAAPSAPRPKVTVARPAAGSVAEFSEHTGRTEARDAVEIRARATGHLERAAFREGDLVRVGVESRRAKAKTGSEAMLGWLAIAHTELKPEGQILVRGELWRARLSSSDSFLAAGERVKVLRADGLTLEVAAVPLTQSA